MYTYLYLVCFLLMPSILFSCFHEYPVLSDVDMYDNDTIYRTDADINALRTMPFIAISLGSNCAPALYFNYYGLRVRSFPFDWNISSADALRAVIQNRCEGWLDLKDLVIDKRRYYKKYTIRFLLYARF